jgi:hypothetical protein
MPPFVRPWLIWGEIGGEGSPSGATGFSQKMASVGGALQLLCSLSLSPLTNYCTAERGEFEFLYCSWRATISMAQYIARSRDADCPGARD